MTINPALQNKLRETYNPEGSNLRLAQLKMLSMLKFLDNICRKNNLQYFLAGGTLLGAIRHGGFIPWDDDIDVYMPRKDANILMKLMKDKIHNDSIILQTLKTDSHYLNSSWITLRDIKSEYLLDEIWHKRQKYRGFQVDIFIIDKGVSIKLKKYITWLHQQLVFRPFVGRKLKYIRWSADFNHRIFDYFIFPLLRLFKFNNKIGIGYGCIFHLFYNEEIIFPLSEIEFEGNKFYAPHSPKEFLTYQYGNWEKLPIESNRRTDHNFKFILL